MRYRVTSSPEAIKSAADTLAGIARYLDNIGCDDLGEWVMDVHGLLFVEVED